MAWLRLDLKGDYFLLCHSHSWLSKRKSCVISSVISEEKEHRKWDDEEVLITQVRCFC